MANFPNWSYNYIPTPGEWVFWFASKQDDLKLGQATISMLRNGLGTSSTLNVAKGTFTLTPNAASTIVPVPLVTPTSFFAGPPTPLTQHAANDTASSSYIIGNGQFLVSHANNARLDRTFSYFIFI